ncbi:MAG: serpin family protein [Polyangiales bacterium]
MRHHNTLIAFAPIVFALAACGGSSPSGEWTHVFPTAPNDPSGVGVAKSSLARDPAAALSPAALSNAVAANNAFALDLYAKLRTTPSNALTSPLSASLALTMAYAGASGNTARQMASALHYGSDAASIFDGQNALSQALALRAAAAFAADQATATNSGEPAPSAGDYNLQVVNSVWGEHTYTWESPFLDILAKSYGTGVYQEDFIHQSEPARQTINAWVSTSTADKINDLLPVGALDDSTRMVLVNAIHVKLPWATPFAASSTAPASFSKSDGTTVSSPFMNQTSNWNYLDDGNAQIVSLPLAGNQLSVVIALPHGDLASYEAGLAPGSAAIAIPSASALVSLSLPKVSFTSPTFSLATALKALGMTDAFDKGAANFTGLCAHTPDARRLYIGDVLQKAMVAMQETGVEAAAATAVIMLGTAMGDGNAPQPVPMVVNRPYLLSIIDIPTGAVLFLGHIEDPSAAP